MTQPTGTASRGSGHPPTGTASPGSVLGCNETRGLSIVLLAVAALAFAALAFAAPALARGPDDAADVALGAEAVALVTRHDVRIYAVPSGRLVADLPFNAREVAWLRGAAEPTLLLRANDHLARWSAAEGLTLLAAGRSTTRLTPGPVGLVYALDNDVRVFDPVTGLSQVAWPGPADDASPEGFVDAAGLHTWDGALAAPRSPTWRDRCTIAPGPAMVCSSGSALEIARAGASRTFRAPSGTSIVGWVGSGPGEGSLLVRDAGATGQVRLVDPAGAATASWPLAEGTWALNEHGVAGYVGDTLRVYGLDGQERMRVDAPREVLPTLAVPEPALLVSEGAIETLLALDDGAVLAVAYNLSPAVVVRDGVATFGAPEPRPRFRAFNEDTWIYEADGDSTTASVRRAATEGKVCGDALGLVTTAGALEAYSLKGARRWSLSAASLAVGGDSPGHLLACDADAWLAYGDAGWALVDPARGKVLQKGVGAPAATLLPVAVVVDGAGQVTWRDGEVMALGNGWRALGLLDASGPLPRAVLASRAGVYARIDATGVRWQARLGGRPVIRGDRVYAAGPGAAVAVDARTGELAWAAPLASENVDSLRVLEP